CVRGAAKPAVDGLQASRALRLADLIEQAVEQPQQSLLQLDTPL
ncbi:MAG TPA: oxidoreductase, partial [Synechococcales bacterium UBA8647]|nr:oxidoreductase [Synechococcales bacterium UBA8647]